MVASSLSSADCQVGRRMIEARIEAGISQSALAGVLGVSLQQLREFEIGLVRPTAAQFLAIAAALHKTAGWFFSEDASEAKDLLVSVMTNHGTHDP